MGHAAAVDRGDVVLAPLLDPLDRPARLAREDQRQRFLRVDVQLRAEPAAHVGRDHAELLLGDAAHARERDLGDVRDLRGGPERELAHGRDGGGQAPARLHGVRDQPRLVVVLLHDHGRGVEYPLVAGPTVAPMDRDVRAELLVDQGRPVGHGGFDVDDRRELGDVDRDHLGRVQRLLAGLGHHDRHRVTVEPDLVLGERVVVRDLDVLGDRPDERQPSDLQVGGRVDADHARHRRRGGGVDRVDGGVDVRRADHGHPHHPGEGVVVDVARLSGEELGVLLAQDLAPDVLLGGRHGAPPQAFAPLMEPAASRIDLTMFW